MLMWASDIEKLVPRKYWYRIPDFEGDKHPAEHQPDASVKVWWVRSIVRTGYWFMPGDLDVPELNELALKWLTSRCGLSSDKVEQLVALMGVDGYDKKSIVESWARLSMNMYHPHLRTVYRRVRSEWLDQQKAEYVKLDNSHPVNLRTFWFFKHQPLVGYVHRRVVRKVGKYSPGRVPSSYYSDDAEMPSLTVLNSQVLYECHVEKGYVYDRYVPYLLVHPSDLSIAS